MIIVQMGDDYRTNGGSIIVQMGDDWGFAPSPICTIMLPPFPRRWPQLTTRAIPRPGSLIITQLRDRHKVAAPVDGHSLLPGRSLALVVLIITQLRDRHEVAAPVDGHSIIVQMEDGAKPLPRRWPQLTTRARDRPGSLHYYPNGGQARSGCSRRWP